MPKDPSNATLRYWQEKNISASEIDWLGLDVKVSLIILNECSTVYLGVFPHKDDKHTVHTAYVGITLH